MKPRRIGLFGGTFNPIHEGHLHIASQVLNRIDLDLILFIPTGLPPHKDLQDILPAEHRMKMITLALSDKPQFVPCDIEIKRAGPSFTIDTIDILRNKFPEDILFFIIGIDAFSQIQNWKSPESLLTRCHFVVISRPPLPFTSLPAFGPLSAINRNALDALDKGQREEYAFKVSPQTMVHFLKIIPFEVSASDIRKDILAGKTTKKRLPHSVESYIIYHSLYRGDDNY